MKRTRRTHGPELNARVAQEASKGIKPTHELAAHNEINTVHVSSWKKELLEMMLLTASTGDTECYVSAHSMLVQLRGGPGQTTRSTSGRCGSPRPNC